MSVLPELPERLNLREQVEMLLPGWQSWYPSLFDAAADFSDQLGCMGQEQVRRCPAPAFVARREVLSYVALGDGAEERIGQRVQADIGV